EPVPRAGLVEDEDRQGGPGGGAQLLVELPAQRRLGRGVARLHLAARGDPVRLGPARPYPAEEDQVAAVEQDGAGALPYRAGLAQHDAAVEAAAPGGLLRAQPLQLREVDP